MRNYSIKEVREYWDSMINNTQALQAAIGGELDIELIGIEDFNKMRDWRYALVGYIISILDNEIENLKGKSVLEIGCSIGIDALEIAKRGGQVTGIDLSLKSIKLARKYFTLNNYKGDFKVGNAEKLEFDDETFDTIWTVGVIHHTPNIENAIEEILRVLRPGGVAYIFLYYKYGYLMFFNKILRQNLEFQNEDAPIINCYSYKDIINLVKKHEFFIEEMKIVGKPTFTIRKGLKSWFYNNLFVRSWNIFPFLSKLFGGGIYVKIKKKV